MEDSAKSTSKKLTIAQRVKRFISKLNILRFLERIYNEVVDFINEKTNFVFWFLLSFIALSTVGIVYKICWLTCLAGLIWVGLFYMIFDLAISVKGRFDDYKKGLEDSKEFLEL